MAKRTPLYSEHQKLNARFTEFGGWDMPVFYSSIIEEHHAVRTHAGLFDTSHMGEFLVSGPNSVPFMENLVPGSMADLPAGKARYTQLLNEEGGIVDDLIVYRRGHDFLLVVNASNSDKDLAWINDHKTPGVTVEDISDRICLLALQGPGAEKILQPLVREDLKSIGSFHFISAIFNTAASEFSIVARTGYTGEDGFEIFLSPEAAGPIWQKLIEAGAVPCGLGCRDTLRLEACMPLHGNDIDDKTTPLEAELNWTIVWGKEFLGKDALLNQKCTGIQRHFAAFILESGIPRSHCDIVVEGKKAGMVTSGTFSPTLKKGIGIGYTDHKLEPGQKIGVVVHGQTKSADVVKKPFYKRKK